MHADETPARAAGGLRHVHLACTACLTLMHTFSRGPVRSGVAMTGPEYYRRGDGQATAGIWAAVTQTHTVLALAAATAVGASGADHRAWADAAGSRF